MPRCVVLALSALVLASCSGDNGPNEPPRLTSITVSPSSSSIGVGQSQTFTAEARDQNGHAMSGVTFAWASSNSGVATVNNGVATGVAAGTTNITASSGSVTSSPAAVTVVIVAAGRLVIEKASVFLSQVGQTAQLTAKLVDAQGAASPVTATWTSSAPGEVSIDASGQLTARAIGSAVIVAEANGIRSIPALVTVAEPQAGALVVSDAQVVSVGPLQNGPGGTPGVGSTYEVVIQGSVGAPAPGTVVLAGETAPVAGTVVSTATGSTGLVVTLRLVPLPELLRNYDISFAIDLATVPAVAVTPQALQRTLAQSWNAMRLGGPRAQSARLDDLEPFRAFDCDGEIKPKLVSAEVGMTLTNRLTLVLDDRPGYSKHALEGTASLTGGASLKLQAGFNAKGKCQAQAQLRFPVLGWVSVLIMPAVRFGVGAALDGEVRVVQGELAVDGTVGLTAKLGWECGGATPSCQGLDDVTGIRELKSKSRIPSENDMEAKISGQFYAVAGLDASLLLGVANAEIVEARVGPKQSFTLAFEEDQAARSDFAANYDLKLEGVVEPGSALQKALEQVLPGGLTVALGAEFSNDISESPKGTLSISTQRVRPDAPVDFTVDFSPASSISYFLLGDNVTGVELWRKREDELAFTRWKAMDRIASNRATYRWVPVEADAGKYEFAAFVNTQLVTPLLEVAANSIKPLEVACFSGSVASGVRTAALQPPVCVDQWIGTSSFTAQTPGLPGDNIATRSNITWTYDPTQSSATVTAYKPSGTFELSFSSSNGCTFVLSPSTFSIAPDLLSFGLMTIINTGVTPPTYSMVGSQLVDFTTTAYCPGNDPVITPFQGFNVSYVSGTGDYAPGQARLNGSFNDGAIVSIWDFSRP